MTINRDVTGLQLDPGILKLKALEAVIDLKLAKFLQRPDLPTTTVSLDQLRRKLEVDIYYDMIRKLITDYEAAGWTVTFHEQDQMLVFC